MESDGGDEVQPADYFVTRDACLRGIQGLGDSPLV